MQETNLLQSVSRFLQRNWDLPVPQGVPNKEDLILLLEKALGELLENDFERLVNTMYRLDVPEAGFRQALTGSSTSEIRRALAELVLEREITRAKFREMYQNRSAGTREESEEKE